MTTHLKKVGSGQQKVAKCIQFIKKELTGGAFCNKLVCLATGPMEDCVYEKKNLALYKQTECEFEFELELNCIKI